MASPACSAEVLTHLGPDELHPPQFHLTPGRLAQGPNTLSLTAGASASPGLAGGSAHPAS